MKRTSKNKKITLSSLIFLLSLIPACSGTTVLSFKISTTTEHISITPTTFNPNEEETYFGTISVDSEKTEKILPDTLESIVYDTSTEETTVSNVTYKKDSDMAATLSIPKASFNNNIKFTLALVDLLMPQINLVGDFSKISHDNPIDIDATYLDNRQTFTMPATLKYQGSSSLSYEKKNFTIKFDKKVTLVDDWGKQKKYCLKANYIDYSQARNVGSAKLYGQIGKTRTNQDDYSNLVNCGAIDGYPIIVDINNEFHGLYTLNIPKDEWLFNMTSDDKRQAIIMGDSWTDTSKLMERISKPFTQEDESIDGMELEYNSRKKAGEYDWITISFNNFIDFLLTTSTEKEFKESITNYINLDRAIDNMLFTQFIYAKDNTAKNILWATFDGIHWTPNVYDLDGTWGLHWNGIIDFDPATWLPSTSKNSNLLWQKLYEFYFNEIKQRYQELRKSILNLDNISKIFDDFDKKIFPDVKLAETEKWPNVPSQDTNNISQIKSFAEIRLKVFDNFFK